jgi:hypothetical protein
LREPKKKARTVTGAGLLRGGPEAACQHAACAAPDQNSALNWTP